MSRSETPNASSRGPLAGERLFAPHAPRYRSVRRPKKEPAIDMPRFAATPPRFAAVPVSALREVRRLRTASCAACSITALTLLVAACGGGGGGGRQAAPTPPPPPAPPPTTISGRAALGLVQNAAVGVQDAGGQELGSATTDSAGRFEDADLGNHAGTLRILVEPATDGSSAYLCDLISGCAAGDGAAHAFGDAVPYEVTLAAVVPTEEIEYAIQVTPFTTAAARRADVLGERTEANVRQANEEMAEALEDVIALMLQEPVDLDDDFPAVPIIDLTGSDGTDLAAADISQAEAMVTLLAIAVLRVADGGEDLGAVLDDLADGFAEAGRLVENDALASAGHAFDIADLLTATADIVAELGDAPSAASAALELLGLADGDARTEVALRLDRLAVAFDAVTVDIAVEQVDSDDDGLPDLDEIAGGTDPADPDTDGDGILDGDDPLPLDVDTDGDGVGDSQDTDDDGDGVDDLDDAFPLDASKTVDPAVFPPARRFAASCETPRTGMDATSGRPFEDRQGSAHDEKLWLRSWSDDLYLWYDEIEHVDPVGYSVADYFRRLRTFARTPSGAYKDQFHFTYDTAYWRQLSQSGVSAGYGAEWVIIASRPPREVAVAFTEPDSPATEAGLGRGARVIAIDGVDMETGSDVDTLNAGLFPAEVGESHEFVVRDLGATETRTVTLTAGEIVTRPVQHVRTLDTDTGPVGYLLFTSHIAPAEGQLVEAMRGFEEAGIADLIVDLRYNGGGYLDIANQLAFMIAGPAAASGRTFDELRFNDKHTVFNPVTGRGLRPTAFHESTLGFTDGLPAGDALPSVNLPRVYVLTTDDTCSASEAIINGLRGIDVEVLLVGGTTCGKPYGFYPADNCGTTYFSVQFQSVNAKGFGEYPDGFSPANLPRVEGVPVPGCAVADDFDHRLGDPAERLLSTALDHRATAACPAPTAVLFARRSLRHAPPSADDAVGRAHANGATRPGLPGAWLREPR